MTDQNEQDQMRARQILERAMKRVSELETIKNDAGLYCILCLASFSKTVVGVAEPDVVTKEELRARAIGFYPAQLASMLRQDFERRQVEIEREKKH
jgi:CO dehydrogenase/acetyl-CoA synthase beta subunit